MKRTVLIADDAAFMRMMLKDILTRAKYEVVGEAAMGEENRALLCTRDGAEGFLSKPFQEKRVLDNLKKILGYHPARTRLKSGRHTSGIRPVPLVSGPCSTPLQTQT